MAEATPFLIMHEIERLRRSAIALGHTHRLDERTSVWLLTAGAWDALRLELSRDMNSPLASMAINRRILGLPVRITVDDDPDTPMVQLLMEPLLAPVVRR